MASEPMQCIVLAGGQGSRLRGTINDALPKCLAPVGGKPFLHWLFRYMEVQGCTYCALSLGYKSEAVLQWLEDSPPPFVVDCVIEETPLGTGGGLAAAIQVATAEDVVVLNGDTLFDIELGDLLSQHQISGAETMLALKPVENVDRYGLVALSGESIITGFQEKMPGAKGLLNGGVYIVNREEFLSRNLPDAFSFEKDYLEAFLLEGTFKGNVQEGYFIDIGVPADYERAQTEIPALLGVFGSGLEK